MPLHKHTNIETYTIIEGKGEIIVDFEKKPVKKGDVILIPSNCEHSLINTSDEILKMMFCYSPGNIVNPWKEELGN